MSSRFINGEIVLAGNTSGGAVPAGRVGEVVTWESVPTPIVTTTTLTDWSGATFTLTPGTWFISGILFLEVTTAADSTFTYANNCLLTTGADVEVTRVTLFCKSPSAAATRIMADLTLSAVVSISSSTVYKLRGSKSTGAGASSITGRSFYAVRIA
jgi:hypothetical protein